MYKKIPWWQDSGELVLVIVRWRREVRWTWKKVATTPDTARKYVVIRLISSAFFCNSSNCMIGPIGDNCLVSQYTSFGRLSTENKKETYPRRRELLRFSGGLRTLFPKLTATWSALFPGLSLPPIRIETCCPSWLDIVSESVQFTWKNESIIGRSNPVSRTQKDLDKNK